MLPLTETERQKIRDKYPEKKSKPAPGATITSQPDPAYLVREWAEAWGHSEKYLREIFSKEKGLRDINRPEDFRERKRAYRTLYVPVSVARRVHERLWPSATFVIPKRQEKASKRIDALVDQANNGGVTRAKIAKVLGITVEDLERVQRVFAVAKVEQPFKQDYPRVLTGPRRIRRKVRRTRETRASIARVLGLSVSDLARVALLTTQKVMDSSRTLRSLSATDMQA